MPSTLLVPTDEWRQCLQAERAETLMLRREAGLERMDTVVDMAGAVAADLEDHEVATAVAAAVLWALLLLLEIGDAVRGRVRMVAEVVAASEAEEVVTSELLHDFDVLLVI